MHQHELDELFAALEEEEEGLFDATIEEEVSSFPFTLADSELAGGYRTRLAVEPRPYQQEALDAWLGAGAQGVVVLPTGAGKTVLALTAVDRLRLRTLIVVPTIELLHQWRSAVIERLGVAASHVGVIGDGKRELRPITIITYASASMPNAPLGGFGLLVCDEAHHVPSPSHASFVERCGAPYRLGITATPERSDGAEAELYRLLGPLVYSRTPAELSAAGHLARFREKRIYVDLLPDEAIRYGILMTEWKWFVARQRSALTSSGDFFGELIKRSGSDPTARRALRSHHQARMIALNAEAKISEVARLLENHRNDKVIIFCEYTHLVDKLSRELALPSITYRTATEERRHTLAAFRNGGYSKLVAGRVLNEGVDVPDASVAIVVSGNSTPREHIQRLGRVLRPKQQEAILYELVTRYTGEVASARKRRGKGGRRSTETRKATEATE
jgi:superfamily II DNA or RNA helicase